MQPMPSCCRTSADAVVHPAVEEIEDGLMDEEMDALGAENFSGAAGGVSIVAGDTDVEGFAGLHSGDEGAHGFFERRFAIGTVTVKNVHVIESQALQALVEAGEEVFARAPFAVGSGPHVVTGFGRDDQLVAMGGEVFA